MKYNLRGSKMEITDAIDQYVASKLEKLDKYFKEGMVNANIVVKSSGLNKKIEVTIPTDKFVLRNEEEHEDLYAAIDLVVDKLERQIRKNKTRLNKRNNDNNFKELILDFTIENEFEEENEKIVKRKTIDMKPMDEEEAVLQMNLLGHSFFVYKDVDTSNICVLYKRKDGNYGIIETNN